MPKLFVKTGDLKDEVFHLEGSTISIGRGQDSPVRLFDRKVSRKHATLIRDGQGYRLEDRSSINGVRVNGEPIVCHTLRFGDEIKIGSTIMVYLPVETETWVGDEPNDSTSSVIIVPDLRPNEGYDMEMVLPTDPLTDLESQAEPHAQNQAFKRLMLLYRISHELTGMVDPKILLRKILERTIDILQADRGFYVALDKETGEPEVQSMWCKANHPDEEPVTISRTIIDYVLKTGKAVLSNDAREDERFEAAQSIVSLDIHSTMSVPIRGKDGILGILQAETYSKAIGFTREDLELMTAICNQVAVAIENATLINDLKHANDVLTHQQKQLIEAEKLSALGQLAAGVAHEINNPMTSILGYAQLTTKILRENPDEPTLKQCAENLDIVEGEAHRCVAIAQTLLQFGRKGPVLKELTRINEVLDRSIAVARFHLNPKIKLATTFTPELPRIVADGQQLQQVFLNLIINARDAMEQGGTLSITSNQVGDDWVRVQVSDTGCGIPKDKLNEIFKPLYTSKEEGTGLGLSVSQDIIDDHNGTIDVSSKPGDGATFTITLPVANLSEDLPENEQA